MNLPQYIQIMVSNYQPLQTTFAISKGDFYTQQIKMDEQFSPIATIVDDVTKQPLDCVLLLHDEKPPEVSFRTLFCYIAVQITVVPYYDTHPHSSLPLSSLPHPTRTTLLSSSP